MHEDVLLSLSRIQELTVIARKSVEKYAETSLTIPQIGGELNVAHILQGSVRRAGDQIRVNVTLVDAGSSATLWGETYDRRLTDIFAIQSEIAADISAQLQVSMDLDTQASLAEAPTQNIEAYELFLKARAEPAQEAKLQLLNQALTIDPGFAEAHAMKVLVLTEVTSFFQRQIIDYDLARKHLLDAERLSPEDPLVLKAGGRLYFAERRFDIAAEYYQKAMVAAPNDAAILFDYADVLFFNGDVNKAYDLLRRVLELDPNSARANVSMVDLLTVERRSSEIDPFVSKAIALAGDDLQVQRDIRFALGRAGRRAESLEMTLGMLEKAPNSISELSHVVMELAVVGELEASKKWLGRVRAIAPKVADSLYGIVLNVEGKSDTEYDLAKQALLAFPGDRSYMERLSYAASGQARAFFREELQAAGEAKRKESIRVLTESLRPEYEDGVLQIRVDAVLQYIVLTLQLAYDGQVELAEAQAQRFIAWSEAQPQINIVNGLFFRGVMYSVLGERDKALDAFLRIETESTGFNWVYWFDVFSIKDPWSQTIYDNIYKDIRMQDMLHRMKQRNEQLAAAFRQNRGLMEATTGLNQL